MKQLSIILTYFIANFSSYSQTSLCLPAIYRDSSYLGIKIAEKMGTSIDNLSEYTFSKTIDSNCTLQNYYCNVSFRSGETSQRVINVLVCKRKHTYEITVDLNFNKDFTDDSTVILSNDTKQNEYHFIVNFNQRNNQKPDVLYLSLKLFEFTVTEINGITHSEIDLELLHKNSIFASFTVGKSLYKVEAIPKYLNNGTGEASIGLSGPNEEINKMNIAKSIFPHRLRNDTIISGKYKFIIDSIDFLKNNISLTSWLLTDADYGYNIWDRIRNYSLPSLSDTTKILALNSLFKNSKYLLLDFWGSWCSPCIKNIPRLKELDSLSQKLDVKVVGITCERKNDLFPSQHILKDLKVKYDNFFINTNNVMGEEVINNLDVLAFPTYILLNRDLKIIMRETNEEGLGRIKDFLQPRN